MRHEFTFTETTPDGFVLSEEDMIAEWDIDAGAPARIYREGVKTIRGVVGKTVERKLFEVRRDSDLFRAVCLHLLHDRGVDEMFQRYRSQARAEKAEARARQYGIRYVEGSV